MERTDRDMKNKTALAEWEGTLEKGRGSLHYGADDKRATVDYSYATRFGNSTGFSPEDLIAAAHAGCFSMALANLISEKKMAPQKIRTFATVSLESSGGGFAIPRVQLETHVHALGLNQELVDELAETAKENCPVSKALAGVEISVEAVLENSLT